MNGKPPVKNSWLAALLAWAIAVVIIAGGYAIYKYRAHQAVDWSLVRNAAGVALLFAVFRGWRDRNRKE